MQMSRSKWFQPLFAVGLGVLFLAAMWIGGDAAHRCSSRSPSWSVFGALILLGGRSETVRGLARRRSRRAVPADRPRRDRDRRDRSHHRDHRRVSRRGRPWAGREPVRRAGRSRRCRLPRCDRSAAPTRLSCGPGVRRGAGTWSCPERITRRPRCRRPRSRPRPGRPTGRRRRRPSRSRRAACAGAPRAAPRPCRSRARS